MSSSLVIGSRDSLTFPGVAPEGAICVLRAWYEAWAKGQPLPEPHRKILLRYDFLQAPVLVSGETILETMEKIQTPPKVECIEPVDILMNKSDKWTKINVTFLHAPPSVAVITANERPCSLAKCIKVEGTRSLVYIPPLAPGLYKLNGTAFTVHAAVPLDEVARVFDSPER